MIRSKWLFLSLILGLVIVFNLFADPPSGYYETTSGLTGIELRSALHEIISTNTNTNYSNSKELMYSSIDNDEGWIKCVYSGYSIEHTVGDSTFPTGFSCEHSYCQSWIDSEISGEENNRAKADLHHLFPVKFSVNIARSNHPFDNVEYLTNSYSEDGGNTISFLGTNQEDIVVFEPTVQHKGDLARSLLYFIVRYETILTFENVEMLETLLEWHYQDLVSSKEIERNDAIYDHQTNRNPFVDHPEFVEEIWVGEPSIHLTFPDQAITLGTSLDYSITWLTQYFYNEVKIELIKTETRETSVLISSTANDGEWQWSSLENIEPNNNYRIRISDASNSTFYDESDENFSIILTDPQSNLFFSEYGEGTSYNKYIEIFNGTGACVDISDYTLKIYYNGNTIPLNTFEFSGLIEKDSLFIIANPSSSAHITNNADYFFGGLNFTGNDAVALYKGNELVDMIGNIGQDPGNGWTAAGIEDASKDHTLVRKNTFCCGNTDWQISAGTNSYDSEWIVYECDNWDYIGFHNLNLQLDIPENVSLSSEGTQVTITWDPVIRAETYHVYSSTDPSADFEEDLSGEFDSTSWTAPLNGNKRFYQITAE